MGLRTSDVVSISEARARLTELAEEVVDGGAEKVLTKNGTSYVAIIDAKKLDYYHALEEEHAGLVLLDEAETGSPAGFSWTAFVVRRLGADFVGSMTLCVNVSIANG